MPGNAHLANAQIFYFHTMPATQQEIVIYSGKNGEVKLNADFRNETVWATHQQIADIFGIDRSGITKHINKIISSREIDKKSNVQFLHIANSDRPVAFYSLDIILSVGYRVNSTKAIEFRKWANSVLKEYLLKGITINQSRLDQLNKTIEIISRPYIPEISGIASILQNFAKSLNLLDNYDHQEFSKPKNKNKSKWLLTYKEARKFIDSMRFGKESLEKQKRAVADRQQCFSSYNINDCSIKASGKRNNVQFGCEFYILVLCLPCGENAHGSIPKFGRSAFAELNFYINPNAKPNRTVI